MKAEPTVAIQLTEEPSADEILAAGVIGEPDCLVKRNPYRYAGYRYDRETQYYYLQQRYYDTRTTRMLSQDVWPGDLKQPLSLNRYLYVVNNPVNLTDPTGKNWRAEDGSSGGPSYYTGRIFYTPPKGPSVDQVPNEDQTLFIQQYYDLGENGYGFYTKLKVKELQVSNGIPVDDDVKIGMRTWGLLVEQFNLRLIMDDGWPQYLASSRVVRESVGIETKPPSEGAEESVLASAAKKTGSFLDKVFGFSAAFDACSKDFWSGDCLRAAGSTALKVGGVIAVGYEAAAKAGLQGEDLAAATIGGGLESAGVTGATVAVSALASKIGASKNVPPSTEPKSRGEQLREKYGNLTPEQRRAKIQDLSDKNYERLGQGYDNVPGAHVWKRHGPQTTPQQQITRATTGLTPDGHQGRPVDSSRWSSARDMVNGVERARNLRNPNIMASPRTQFEVNLRSEHPVGEVWAKRTGDYLGVTSNFVVRFDSQTGQVYTAYPTRP